MKTVLKLGIIATLLICLCSCDPSKRALDNKGLIAVIESNGLATYKEAFFPTEGVFNSEPHALKVVELAIEKRQTNIDKKEDVVYCTILFKNALIERTTNCVLYLNYYDKGGWVLDNCTVKTVSDTPLAPPTNDLIGAHKIMKTYKSAKIKNVELDGNIAKALVSVNEDYPNFTMSGDITFSLEFNINTSLWSSQKIAESDASDLKFNLKENALGEYATSNVVNNMKVSVYTSASSTYSAIVLEGFDATTASMSAYYKNQPGSKVYITEKATFPIIGSIFNEDGSLDTAHLTIGVIDYGYAIYYDNKPVFAEERYTSEGITRGKRNLVVYPNEVKITLG